MVPTSCVSASKRGNFGSGAEAGGVSIDTAEERLTLLTVGCPLLSVRCRASKEFLHDHGITPNEGANNPSTRSKANTLSDMRDPKFVKNGQLGELHYLADGSAARLAIYWERLVASDPETGAHLTRTAGICGHAGLDADGAHLQQILEHWDVAAGIQKSAGDTTGITGVLINSGGHHQANAIYNKQDSVKWRKEQMCEKLRWGDNLPYWTQEEAMGLCRIGVICMDEELLLSGVIESAIEKMNKNPSCITVLRFSMDDACVDPHWELTKGIIEKADWIIAPQRVWARISDNYGIKDVHYPEIPERCITIIPRADKTKSRLYMLPYRGLETYVGYSPPLEQGKGRPLTPPPLDQTIIYPGLPDYDHEYVENVAWDAFITQVLFSLWHGGDIVTSVKDGFRTAAELFSAKYFNPNAIVHAIKP